MKATANGIETYYELHGREGAPWLVFSHSLACNVRMWDPQVEAFRERFRILLYDTRGHGQSAAPKGPYSLEGLADDLAALLKELRIQRPHFIGLSMGGMIGQTAALRFPDLFQTLTLADTTSRYPAEALPLWEARVRTAETQGLQPLVQPTLERWFTEGFRKRSPGKVAEIGKAIAATPVAGYAGCSQAIPKIDLTARLKDIKCPVLVLCGDKDPGTPPQMSREIHDNLPGSKLVMIPDAAHLANVEQPGHFNRALEEFLTTR